LSIASEKHGGCKALHAERTYNSMASPLTNGAIPIENNVIEGGIFGNKLDLDKGSDSDSAISQAQQRHQEARHR